jgi:hypothetical protein
MPWTDRQWDSFVGLIEEGWPGEFDDRARRSWRTLLEPVTPATAVAALRALLLEGHRYRPSVSDLLAKARRDPSRPTFDEMLVLVFGARGCLRTRVPAGTYASESERAAAKRAAVLAACDGMHPLVAAFVHRQGADRLAHMPLDDPDQGHWRRRELREAWVAHVDAFDGREVAALASGGGQRELHQLDPLAALGLPTPQPALVGGDEEGSA